MRVALVTGAARRIGAAIASKLHAEGYRVILHYRSSTTQAQHLVKELNRLRPASAQILRADLCRHDLLAHLVTEATSFWGRLDVLINNASSFYATQLGTVNEAQWDELLGSNLKAPFFLSQAAAPMLREHQGTIVNLVDIHAEGGLRHYPVYSIAKAGLAAMTRVLAKELAPEIRVNGVAPGAVLWPEHDMDGVRQAEIISRIPLKHPGEPADIAKAVLYLVDQAPYVTGQIITVDGGRSLHF